MVASFGIAAAAFLLTLQPALALIAGTSANNIFARQLGSFDPNTIPSSCISTSCQALAAVSKSNCTTLKCLCTTTFANGLNSCIQCAVTAGVSGLTQAQANDAINQFVAGCADGGFPISGVSGGTTGGTSGSSGGGLGGSSGGLGSSPTATGRVSSSPTATNGLGAGTNTLVATSLSVGANTAAAAAPANTGDSLQPPKVSAASKVSVGIFGVMVTAALGAILLL